MYILFRTYIGSSTGVQVFVLGLAIGAPPKKPPLAPERVGGEWSVVGGGCLPPPVAPIYDLSEIFRESERERGFLEATLSATCKKCKKKKKGK